MPQQLSHGWGKSPASRKWHYFNNSSRSLCMTIAFYFGEAEEGDDDNADNCAKCRRLKKKLPLAADAPYSADEGIDHDALR